MKSLIIISSIFLLPLSLAAQQNLLNKNSFDFWFGQWQVSWTNADGDTISGTNHVRRILGQAVIQENFKSPTGLEGKSWSVFNAQTKS